MESKTYILTALGTPILSELLIFLFMVCTVSHLMLEFNAGEALNYIAVLHLDSSSSAQTIPTQSLLGRKKLALTQLGIFLILMFMVQTLSPWVLQILYSFTVRKNMFLLPKHTKTNKMFLWAKTLTVKTIVSEKKHAQITVLTIGFQHLSWESKGSHLTVSHLVSMREWASP